MDDLSIQGLQEAQRDNLRMIRSLQPDGSMGQAVQVATVDMQRYAVSVTHVDSGALRASHRIDYSNSYDEARANIFIDPSARNPRSRALTSVYGPVEEARGGSHAFYERTMDEEGDRALDLAANVLIRGLDG